MSDKKQVKKRVAKLAREVKHEAKRVKLETPIKGSKAGRQRSNAPIKSDEGIRRVSAPVAVGVQMTRMGPRVIGNKFSEKGTTFIHRENFGQVVATTSYGVTQYSINPGLANLFPWLSQETVGFESYVVESMSFEFVPFISSAADGTLVLCVDYDAADSAPSNRQQALNLAEAVSGQVWSSNVLHCGKRNTHKMVTERYLRSGALASNLDVKTYDVGKLYVITEGAESGKLIGDLYVDYKIRLRTSQFNTGSMASVNSQMTFDLVLGGILTVNTAASTIFPVLASSGSSAPYTRTPFVVSGNVTGLVSTNDNATLAGLISGSVSYSTVPYAKSQAGRYTFGLDANGRVYLPMGTWVVRTTSSIASNGTAVLSTLYAIDDQTISGITRTTVLNKRTATSVDYVGYRIDIMVATSVGAYFRPLIDSQTWSTGGNVTYEIGIEIKPYGGDTVTPVLFKLEDGMLWSRDQASREARSDSLEVEDDEKRNGEFKEFQPATFNSSGGSSSAAPSSSCSVSREVNPFPFESRGLNGISGQTGVIPAGPSCQPFLMRKS